MEKYSLDDLTKEEIMMIYKNREYKKTAKMFSNLFAVCIIVSFVLVITLTQKFHNVLIGSASFIPVIAFFVLSWMRNRQIKRTAERMLNAKEEEASAVSSRLIRG